MDGTAKAGCGLCGPEVWHQSTGWAHPWYRVQGAGLMAAVVGPQRFSINQRSRASRPRASVTTLSLGLCTRRMATAPLHGVPAGTLRDIGGNVVAPGAVGGLVDAETTLPRVHRVVRDASLANVLHVRFTEPCANLDDLHDPVLNPTGTRYVLRDSFGHGRSVATLPRRLLSAERLLRSVDRWRLGSSHAAARRAREPRQAYDDCGLVFAQDDGMPLRAGHDGVRS